MRRLLAATPRTLGVIAFLGGLAVGVSAASSDQGSPRVYWGPLDGGGAVRIELGEGRVGNTEVERRQWIFRRVVVSCEGMAYTALLPVEGADAVNARYADRIAFGYTAVNGSQDDPSYATKVHGRASRHRAHGYVRVWGSAVKVVEGKARPCDSGRVRWVAKR